MSRKSSPRRAVLFGATSGIGEAVARKLAADGWDLGLCGRDESKLEVLCQDLRIRHEVDVFSLTFEALAFESHQDVVDQCVARSGDDLELVLVCHGLLEDEEKAQQDVDVARRVVDVNYTSVVSLLERFAVVFAERETGVLAAISSVAGLRGRQSNYHYGSAKAALNSYLQGLRNRLYHHGVHVLTILPGFVYTDMTRDLLDPKGRLVAQPDRVAANICRAIRRRQNVVYTPWFWRPIMFIIRSIPEWLFKRLKM